MQKKAHVRLNADLIPSSLRPAAEAIVREHLPHPDSVEIHYEGSEVSRAVLAVPVWAFGRILDWREDEESAHTCVDIDDPQLSALEEDILKMLRANSIEPCS